MAGFRVRGMVNVMGRSLFTLDSMSQATVPLPRTLNVRGGVLGAEQWYPTLRKKREGWGTRALGLDKSLTPAMCRVSIKSW